MKPIDYLKNLVIMASADGALTEREIDYLIRAEWAQTADDVLWRRTKLGLILTETEQTSVATAMLNKRQVMVTHGSSPEGERAA